jgi:hypothetical protein
MRPEYLVNFAGQNAAAAVAPVAWVPEKALLPRFELFVRDFNAKRNAFSAKPLQDEDKRIVYHRPKKAECKIPAEPEPVPDGLPPFLPTSAPLFKWGSRDGVDFISDVNLASGGKMSFNCLVWKIFTNA